MSTVEQSVLATLDARFGNRDVKSYPLQGPDGVSTTYYGLFEVNSWEQVSSHSVTKRYRPHTLDQVKRLVEASLSLFPESPDFRLMARWNKGHYVHIAPSDAYRESIAGSDTVWPRLRLSAGYDADTFNFSMLIHRDACVNLMEVDTVGTVTNVRFKHTESLDWKVDDIVEKISKLNGSYHDIINKCRQMREADVSWAETIEHVLGNVQSTRSENEYRGYLRRLRDELINQEGWTQEEVNHTIRHERNVPLWSIYNAIQGYRQHDGTRRGRPDSYQRAVAALPANDQKVRKLNEYASQILGA